MVVGERETDLPALGDGGERLTDVSLAAPLFAEGLRARDVGERAVVVLSRDGCRILGVREPVEMRKFACRPFAGLRDKGDVAGLRQAGKRPSWLLTAYTSWNGTSMFAP